MASVVSLGLHQPTGLQHAVQEHLLPPDPSNASYSWENHFEDDADSIDSILDEDELLVTPRCVIWSRGGVYRKSYKFDLEKEPVSQALLTSFPSVGPLESKDTTSTHKKGVSKRSAAIVVFLKTQAHIYFLSGTSHVIHLPFEVESAIAAPNGIIIQRKLRVDNLVPASLKFPKVPPNSFVSSQPQPWSASSSQQSTFSIADLGAPKQLSMRFSSTLKDLWDPPALKNDANWPRLFSLTDPLSEMGLIVEDPSNSDGRAHQRSSEKTTALDTAEEILHVSRRGEFSDKESNHPLILALTLNRETSMYTVWKLSYIGEETAIEKRRVASDNSRRRSSFVPGTATGATTPVLNSQPTFRESLGGNAPGVGVKTGKKQADVTKEKPVDFAATLDPDWENPTIPKKKSRRVSSMLARADLSANHERSAFSELATGHQHTTNRRGESLGSQHGRVSNGVYGGTGGPSLSQASQFNHSLNSFLEAPVDELLDELRAGGDFEGFHNMGLDDEEFDALKQEVVLSKVCSVPAEHSNVRYSSQHMPAASQCKIFMLTAPPSAADEQLGNAIVICVLDLDEKRLLVLTLYKNNHDPKDNHIRGRKGEKHVSLGPNPIMRAKGVLDACRLDDGHISRILVLTETRDGYGELSLQAPWSEMMNIPLPVKFTISNVRNLGHDATPRARREGGFKRVLSQGPRALGGLRNSKPHGFVDLVDDEGKMHQLQISLEPRNPHVGRILEVCRAVLPGPKRGEGVLVGWWNAMQWLRLESPDTVDMEWTALVITLFSMVLGLGRKSKSSQNKIHAKKKSRTGFLRSSSGAQSDLESWQMMQTQETSNGNPLPSWAGNSAWKWLADDENTVIKRRGSEPVSPVFTSFDGDKPNFVQWHVKLARDFTSSTIGQSVVSGILPISGNRDTNSRRRALVDTFVGLHLLHEEQKLNTMMVDAMSSGAASLTPVLAQMAHWLGWSTWINYYEVEEASLLDLEYDSGKLPSGLEIHFC
jgi:anaphase-promoting complex subunit 1